MVRLIKLENEMNVLEVTASVTYETFAAGTDGSGLVDERALKAG